MNSDILLTLQQSRLWVEANTAQVRALSAEAAAPGEAMLRQIDEAIEQARTAIVDPETERRLFEAWAAKAGLDFSRDRKDAWGRAIYTHEHLQSIWSGWLACAETRRATN